MAPFAFLTLPIGTRKQHEVTLKRNPRQAFGYVRWPKISHG